MYRVDLRLVECTTRHGYDLKTNLKNRVQVRSPDFQVRLVAGTTLRRYELSNFPLQYYRVKKL